MRDRVQEAAEFIRRQCPEPPPIAVVLGSGLGEFGDTLERRIVLDAREIPHYPRSTVEGHKGKIVWGNIGDLPLLALQGRIHFYETEDIEAVLFPMFVIRELGVRSVILTNAAGGINPQLEPGDLMAITDQINLTGLGQTGKGRGGGRIYTRALLELLLSVAESNRIPVRQGTYVGVKGPSYETAAEIGMIRHIGGDAVGMSTVLEASTASRLGLNVAGISCITNKSTGLGGEKLNHQEVTEVAERVKGVFIRLLSAFVRTLGSWESVQHRGDAPPFPRR